MKKALRNICLGLSIFLFPYLFAQKFAQKKIAQKRFPKYYKPKDKKSPPLTNFKRGTLNFKALFTGQLRNESDVDLIFSGINHLRLITFGTRVGTGIFIQENMSMGIDFNYHKTNYTLVANIFRNFLTRYIQSATKGFSVHPFIKHYTPLNHKKNIYLTNQTELQYSFQIRTFETPINKKGGTNFPILGEPPPLQVLQRKFSDINTMGLGIRPGLLVFVNKHIAFETAIGILSIQYKNEKVDYQYDPNKMPDPEQIKPNITNKSVNWDFGFDILKFDFGIAYYL